MFPDNPTFRRSIYYLLILISIAIVCARILSAQLVWEPDLNRDENDFSTFKPRIWPPKRPDPVPTFGSNDRSRLATAIALVDNGTYVIGRRDADLVTQDNPYGNQGIIFDTDGWRTIDVVLNPQTQEFYSSKPPLLATIVAGEYWLLKHALGLSLKSPPGQPDDRWTVVRVILLTFNALPMLIYLLLLARLVEDYGTTDWGRIFVMAAACFGTMLTPFAITLNNHSVATCSAMFAIYPMLRISSGGLMLQQGAEASRLSWLVAGFFAGFTACMELPALAFAALIFLLLAARSWRQTLLYFVPPALVPVAAFLVTNYLAIGELIPAYDKTSTVWYQYPGSVWNREEHEANVEKYKELADSATDEETRQKYDAKARWEFRNIDWAWHPMGAHESKLAYTIHLLVGHHGLFSLMPIFIFSVAGTLLALRRLLSHTESPQASPQACGIKSHVLLAACTLPLLVIVVGFYIYRSNNYGGWTNGPRWFMWLTPLLLLAMLSVADWLSARRWGRWVAYACLAISIFSMNYWSWNPWRHPWIYNVMESNGWIQY